MGAWRDRAGQRTARVPLAAALVALAAVVALAGACVTEADESPLAGTDAERRQAQDERSPAGPDAGPDGGPDDTPAAGADDRPAGFAATARYLAEVGDRSSGLAHRFSMAVSMRVVGTEPGQLIDVEAPMMIGEQAGDRAEMHMDMAAFTNQLADALGEPGLPPGMDVSMDAVLDGETLYLRAPFFGAVAETAPPGADLGPIQELMVLGDQWGRIDLTDLGGFSLGQLQQAMGGPASSDPEALLDVLDGAAAVEDLGTDEIDGTPVSGLRAQLSMEDMLAAQGTDADEFLNGFRPGPGVDREEAAARLLGLEVPFEVWVDGAGHARRISYEMDLAGFAAGPDPGMGAGGVEEMVIGMRMDFSAYGDPSIAVEPPADAVDVTDAYHAFLRAGTAAAAGAAGNPLGS